MFIFNESNNQKLYNLKHALSLSINDFDDIDDDDNDIAISKTTIRSTSLFLDIAERCLLGDVTPTPLDIKILLNANNSSDTSYDGELFVNNTEELIKVLSRAYKHFGPNGNYNWINTTNITSLLGVFQNALGKEKEKFNGDISRWNTCNMKNLLNAFNGCSSLTCDISNWDTSNVKFWNPLSYAGTPPEFQKICKKLKFPKKITNLIK